MKVVVTGAGGFIGASFSHYIHQKGKRLVGVDDFTQKQKRELIGEAVGLSYIDRSLFIEWLDQHHSEVSHVIHLGARTDTAEMDVDLFDRLNLNYSKAVWNRCVQFQIPLLYASSAATYGGGEHGFDDDQSSMHQLEPLNPYGQSKQDFDLWVLDQVKTPPHWSGFKFFNVYGPNEHNKGRMASVIFHTFHKIKQTGGMKLFRSHKEGIKDGHQSRDFVYIKDVVQVLNHFLENGTTENSGIYNLGTGEARTFLDLAKQTFVAQGLEPNISFVDTPIDIRDKYQYFTEANISKLRSANYSKSFYSLEEGIKDYVKNYLVPNKTY